MKMEKNKQNAEDGAEQQRMNRRTRGEGEECLLLRAMTRPRKQAESGQPTTTLSDKR